MPFVVVKRCPGGANPDLIPGMRLGDKVRRTLESAGFVKWFPEDKMHLAPPEPAQPVPELVTDEHDLADLIPDRDPAPVPPAVEPEIPDPPKPETKADKKKPKRRSGR